MKLKDTKHIKYGNFQTEHRSCTNTVFSSQFTYRETADNSCHVQLKMEGPAQKEEPECHVTGIATVDKQE
jgi:hypothetical protein